MTEKKNTRTTEIWFESCKGSVVVRLSRTHCGSPALLHGDFIVRVAIVTGVEEGFVNVGLAARFTVFLSFSAALFLISTLPVIWRDQTEPKTGLRHKISLLLEAQLW